MAMLTVTLVATFAAASLWQQWRSVEVETAERSRVQSSWVLTGALDWARLILREDARSGSGGSVDHLGEPWAVPLQESRLSTFLAADRNNTGGQSENQNDDTDAFLSGQIIDLQSRLNITNLIGEDRKISKTSFEVFTRLFEALNLPVQELSVMAENLRRAAEAGVMSIATTPGTANASNSADSPLPLMPQRAEQLGWLGLSPSAVAALQPFVTVLPFMTALPARTPVNLNTASVEVLQANLGISRSDAQRLVTARARNPFRSAADAKALLNRDDVELNSNENSVTSRFFEVQGRLRIGPNMVVERALVQRDGINVVMLWRERSAVDTVASAMAAAR